MADEIGGSAPLAPAESFATPEAAQAEYKRYAGSPEFQAAQTTPHAKGPAMSRLEALARAAWPEPGIQASPVPGSKEEAHKAAVEHVELAQKGEPLSEAEQQQVAQAFAPQSPHDYQHALPGEEFAELRTTLFEHGVSKSAANLIAAGSTLIEPTLALSDDEYYGRVDKAAADVKAMPGGSTMARKALDMIAAIPDDHFYRPFAEYLMTLPGGIIEIAHWSDRLRARQGIR